MTDRSAALDAAVRAQDKLIAEAQRLLKAYVETNRVHRRNQWPRRYALIAAASPSRPSRSEEQGAVDATPRRTARIARELEACA